MVCILYLIISIKNINFTTSHYIFNNLRRIKAWLLSTMHDNKLCSIALINIPTQNAFDDKE